VDRVRLTLAVALFVAGVVAILAGVGLQFGWPWSSIIGGAMCVAFGLLVIDVKGDE
jgi:hypothetical protein